jgi:hypothetical protein
MHRGNNFIQFNFKTFEGFKFFGSALDFQQLTPRLGYLKVIVNLMLKEVKVIF